MIFTIRPLLGSKRSCSVVKVGKQEWNPFNCYVSSTLQVNQFSNLNHRSLVVYARTEMRPKTRLPVAVLSCAGLVNFWTINLLSSSRGSTRGFPFFFYGCASIAFQLPTNTNIVVLLYAFYHLHHIWLAGWLASGGGPEKHISRERLVGTMARATSHPFLYLVSLFAIAWWPPPIPIRPTDRPPDMLTLYGRVLNWSLLPPSHRFVLLLAFHAFAFVTHCTFRWIIIVASLSARPVFVPVDRCGSAGIFRGFIFPIPFTIAVRKYYFKTRTFELE